MEKLKSLNSSELAALIKKYSPFFKEIRKRITIVLAVFAVATFAGFIFYEKIISQLLSVFSLQGVNIVFTSPFQFINLSISCGITTGLIVVMPMLITQVIAFLGPALKKYEYKIVVRLLPFSIILFLIGFVFGSLIMKWQIQIFLNRSISLGIGNILDISNLLSTILITSSLMGIGFQFPIILLLLMHIGIINHQQISKKRPWFYLGSVLFALLLPPDSIVADIFLSLPLIFLFESTLVLKRLLDKKRDRSQS